MNCTYYKENCTNLYMDCKQKFISLARLGKALYAWSRLYLRFKDFLFSSAIEKLLFYLSFSKRISWSYRTSYFTLVLSLTNNQWSCSFISTRPLATKEERHLFLPCPGSHPSLAPYSPHGTIRSRASLKRDLSSFHPLLQSMHYSASQLS